MQPGDEKTYEALRRYWGFGEFRPVQLEIIRSVLAGRDTLALMPTGGGKSLTYQVPTMTRQGLCIVVTPLIALMKDQVDRLRARRIPAVAIHSGLTPRQIDIALDNCAYGDVKFLYVAPERLATEAFRLRVERMNVQLIAVDEAHCISQWGYDFRPSYLRIAELREKLPGVPVLALTASATKPVTDDIMHRLRFAEPRLLRSSFARPNLSYSVRRTDDKNGQLLRLVRNVAGSGIVYMRTREGTEQVAALLRDEGIAALAYHGGLPSAERALRQEEWVKNKVRVMVATNAFGMGIDKPDVRYVIHYDIPKSLEGYYQETGRAGRDGGEGHCLTFYSYKDIQKLEKFMQGKPVAEQEIGKLLLVETVSYAESSMCRRKTLLHYFGEEYAEENCQNCDNCRNPKPQVDAKAALRMALEALRDIGDKFKSDYLVSVLIGKNTALIKSYGHNKSKWFGAGEEHDARFWGAVIRQALILGLVDKNIENYGLISINPKGEQFITMPFPVNITLDHNYDQEEKEAVAEVPMGKGGAADEELFSMLKDLRKKVAKKHDLPPFVIVRNDTLRFAGINKIGLSRRGFTPERIAEIHEACRILFQSGLNYLNGCSEVERSVPQSPERDYLVEFIRSSKRGIIKPYASGHREA